MDTYNVHLIQQHREQLLYREELMTSFSLPFLPRNTRKASQKDYGWLSDHLPLLANIPVSDIGVHIQTIDKREVTQHSKRWT
jgi:hypothetical protein